MITQGQLVRVRPDYHCRNHIHRRWIGRVIGQLLNIDDPSSPFTDYLVQFPHGEIEPFGAWEIDPIAREEYAEEQALRNEGK